MLTTAERNRDRKVPLLCGTRSKAEMKRLEAAGHWNHFRSWNTYEEFVKSDYVGWTTIRSFVRDSPFFVPEVPPGAVWLALYDLKKKDAKPEDLYIQEIPDPAKVRRHINFEVQRTPQHYLILKYGTGQCSLRQDLEANGVEVYDLEAKMTLEYYLGPQCWEELQTVLDKFPHDCIEGTRFNQKVGVYESELVLWEARSY